MKRKSLGGSFLMQIERWSFLALGAVGLLCVGCCSQPNLSGTSTSTSDATQSKADDEPKGFSPVRGIVVGGPSTDSG